MNRTVKTVKRCTVDMVARNARRLETPSSVTCSYSSTIITALTIEKMKVTTSGTFMLRLQGTLPIYTRYCVVYMTRIHIITYSFMRPSADLPTLCISCLPTI